MVKQLADETVGIINFWSAVVKSFKIELFKNSKVHCLGVYKRTPFWIEKSGKSVRKFANTLI